MGIKFTWLHALEFGKRVNFFLIPEMGGHAYSERESRAHSP